MTQVSPVNQRVLITMALLAAALFWLWGARAFRRADYNRLALAFAVLVSFWFLTTAARWLADPVWIGPCGTPKPPGSQPKPQPVFFELAAAWKCFFGEARCGEGDFTLWTVGHFVAYLLIGLYAPGLWLEVLAASVAGELIENGMGFPAKYFLDPAVNLFGYALGTFLAWRRGGRRARP